MTARALKRDEDIEKKVKDLLPKDIADLLCPILEINRQFLGAESKSS